MAITVRLEGGPLHGKEAPVAAGQDELRLIVSSDDDAQIGLDTPEQVYRRVDAGTFAFERTATVRERVSTEPPTRITTLLLPLASLLARRLRIAALAQVLLLLVTPSVSTLSLEGFPRYTIVIGVGVLLVLFGLPALALLQQRDSGRRVSRWDHAIGVLSLSMAVLGGVFAGVALNLW